MTKSLQEQLNDHRRSTSKEGQREKVPLRLVNSRSTAVLLFNRNGFEEKEHLNAMYKHCFFNERNEIEHNTERDARMLVQQHSTKRLDTAFGCVLTKRNSLALVPKHSLTRRKYE